MKNRLLFPASFKIAGLILVLVAMVLFVLWDRYNFEFSFLQTSDKPAESLSAVFTDNNLTNELIGIIALLGLVFIAFSRERMEDERTQLLRLQSLQISHYCNYALFAVLLFTINGISFPGMMLLLPYLFLITFIIIYYLRLYLLPKFAFHEK